MTFPHFQTVVGHISMLYVNMEVNGVAIKAFVDSGAQMTIMTQVNLQRLCDKKNLSRL